MKLTASRLKEIIKEQLETVLLEQESVSLMPGYEIDRIDLEKVDKKGNVFGLEYIKARGNEKSANKAVKVDSKKFRKTIQDRDGSPIEIQLTVLKNKTPGADKDPAFKSAPIRGRLIIQKNDREEIKPWSPAVEKYVNSEVQKILAAPEFKELK
jgi:hypothetical protein